jgi:phospholipid/cholesterol/gamma-HCH transport system substrate-binding protein
VGTVSAIRLNKKNPQQVRLLLSIKEGTPINQSTIATLKSMGITGVAYVGLSATKSVAPAIPVLPGHKYPAIQSEPSLLETLSDALKDSADNITKLSSSIQKLVSKKNQEAITASLKNIQSITKNLANNEDKLNKIIGSVNTFSGNMAKASKGLPDTMASIQKTLNAVQAMSKNITITSQSVDKTIDSSHVLVQNVSEQMMPEFMTLMQKINGIATHMQGLTRQLQNNPSILVRGKVPATPGPGEK